MPEYPQRDLDHVLTHAAGVWAELEQARIFVTGGTGFFGRWMLESLLHANRRLGLRATAAVLTRDAAAFQRRAPHLTGAVEVEVLEGDIRDFAFPAAPCTHVVHLATETDLRRQQADPIAMVDTIVEGTRRALDYAAACGARAFLLASSGAVYGRQPADLANVPEEFTGGPDSSLSRSAYGEAKRLAELLACLYAERRSVPAKIARCFAFAGPGLPLDQHFAIGNFIGDALAGRPLVIRGNGTPMRSYMYASDLAVWLWTILVSGLPARPYNTGSAEAISIRDLADLVRRTLNAPGEIQLLDPVPAKEAPERYVPAVERAQRELGLRVRVDLPDAVRRTAEWHKLREDSD